MAKQKAEVKEVEIQVPPQLETKEEVSSLANDKGEVTIELDQNNEPIQQEKKNQEHQYVKAEELEKLQKSINSSFYNQRKMEEKMDKILGSLYPKESPKAKENEIPSDEYDQMLQKDWKGTVYKMAEEKFQELRRKENEQLKIQAEELKRKEILEKNKQKVIQKHPDINDPSSEKSRLFQEVIDENPDYISDPFGPVLAMRDMEDRLRDRGIIDEPIAKAVEKEVNRMSRAQGSMIPSSRSSSNTNKIILSKEDREFCDLNGIKYEKYAKIKQSRNVNGGVEI